MNNKEFISALSKKTGYKINDTQNIVRTTIHAIVDEMSTGESVFIGNLGTFEVKKRMERIIINPGTGQKMLVPPKLVVNFKTVSTLKDKLKK